MIKLTGIAIFFLSMTVFSAGDTTANWDFDIEKTLSKEWWYPIAKQYNLTGLSGFNTMVILGSHSIYNDTAYIQDGICILDEGITGLIVKSKKAKTFGNRLFASNFSLERFDKKTKTPIETQKGAKAVLTITKGNKTEILILTK